MTATTTIRTPKGKRITDRQYFALCGAAFSRNTSQECSNGCLDCAAWHGGPCRWEVADRLQVKED
jgi:hypothetical protein